MTNAKNYYRPSTRGELCEKLKEGVECETVSYAAEMTSHILKGWLRFDAFTTRPSENEGWTVFEPELTTPHNETIAR